MRITAYDPDHGNSVATGAAFSAAGGDLSGTLPGPTVTGIDGYPIDFTGLADGYVIVWDAAGSKWVVAPEAGGTGFELNTQGGQSVIKPHGSLGAAATFDPADGNVHTGTLSANCTFTLTAPTGTGACTLELRLAQDVTGGWAVTWPGSVTVVGTLVTTASTTSIVIVESLDGGTTWVAVVVGSGGVTSVGLTMPAEFSVTGSPVTSAGTLAVAKATQSANLVYAGPASGSAAAPAFRALVAADIPAGVVGANDHEHVMGVLFSGDGSTVAFTLPAAPFDAYSVAAFVAGVLTEVTLSGADLTTATFGSAPASAADNVRFDIVAAVV